MNVQRDILERLNVNILIDSYDAIFPFFGRFICFCRRRWLFCRR